MYHFKRLSWLVLCAALIVIAHSGATIALAQCDTYATFNGEAGADRFGRSVSGAGDVDNDGADDVIVGAWDNDAAGSGAGRAYVYSGQTSALLYTFTGTLGSDNFGWSVSGVGDVNLDGHDDVIVSARNAGGTGETYLYSGIDGTLLHTFSGASAGDRFGWSVSGAGDVNGDLIPDIVIGAPGTAPSGVPGLAYVYSGADYSELYMFTGEGPDDSFGGEVADAGDVNNDGRADVIVGANLNDAGGVSAGRAYVYSGLNGSVLHTFTGLSAGGEFGFSVAGGVDLDEDGFDDLIVGAITDGSAGAVHTFSGQTGVLLYSIAGEVSGDNFGRSVDGIGDVNGDGVRDVVVGAKFNDVGANNAGRAYIHSGKYGTLLHVFTGVGVRRNLGSSVANAGDVNQDGLDDIIAGGPRRGAGLARLYTCIPPQPIPTLSEWGAIIFGTFLLAALVLYTRRRRVQHVPVR